MTDPERNGRPHLRNVSHWVRAVRWLVEAVPVAGMLMLWTCDVRVQAEGFENVVARRDPSALLAERSDDAKPLPWLQTGQTEAVAGRWPFALGAREPTSARRERALPNARVCGALPVAAGSPVP